MVHQLLTTAEAARRAGVGASSVKRWADQQLLRCVRTAGGHRRFHREELDAFLHEHGETLGGPGDWVELVLEAGGFELQGELYRARDRLGAWHAVAAELGSALTELGARWERGEITVIEEHVASEKLSRALGRVVESLPSSDADPHCLLATAEDDEHTLGLSLVEVCLRETGWATLWSGRRTPTQGLIEHTRSRTLDLLALSASAGSTNAARLGAQAEEVGRACRNAGIMLVLGGRGAWPEQPSYGTRVRDLDSLHRLASAWRAALPRRTRQAR
jgi:excisionase family DNA binding protein